MSEPYPALTLFHRMHVHIVLTVIPLVASLWSPSSSLYMTSMNSEGSDRLARWNDRWQNHQIGWHESDVHEALKKYGDRLLAIDSSSSCATQPSRVLVSLCGKTVDMANLARHDSVQQVVGVDGVRKALEEFSTEHPDLNIQPLPYSDRDKYARFQGDKIALLQGDFFTLDETATDGRFEAILDRASLVAIEPNLRELYVQVMGRLITPGGRILLVVIERRSGTEADLSGPPFSVPESEVRRLYETQDWVESVTLLEDKTEQARNEGSTMVSLYYLIQAK